MKEKGISDIINTDGEDPIQLGIEVKNGGPRRVSRLINYKYDISVS